MRVPWLDVHMAEQMLVHIMTVGVWVGRKQPNIFIQIKSAAKRKIELLLFVPSHKLAIDALHGLTSGQAQDEVRVGTQVMRGYARDKRCRSFIIWLYYYFHKGAIRLSLALPEEYGNPHRDFGHKNTLDRVVTRYYPRWVRASSRRAFPCPLDFDCFPRRWLAQRSRGKPNLRA